MLALRTGCIIIAALSALLFSQTKDAYDQGGGKTNSDGLLDAQRLSIHHSLSFGMGTSSMSSMQSQGLYSTLLTYQFSQPVTLHLNFGFPLFSSFSPYQNLTQQNLTSTQYFKNMPIDVALSWKPTDNLFFQVNVVRNPQGDFYSGMGYPYYYRPMFFNSSASSK